MLILNIYHKITQVRYRSHLSTICSMKIRSIDVLNHNNAHFNKSNCKIHICANWHKHIEIKRISTISLIKRYFKSPFLRPPLNSYYLILVKDKKTITEFRVMYVLAAVLVYETSFDRNTCRVPRFFELSSVVGYDSSK